jgi:hypothetical protein
MSDPTAGHAWRSARHMPRTRPGVFGLGRRGDSFDQRDESPLCVLLLPHELEAMEGRARAEDLLGAPGVVAIDPARISYRALSRLPESVHAGLATGQARRMRLPGVPRALVLFGGLQYPLARAVISDFPDAELWLAEPAAAAPADASRRMRTRVEDLTLMASARADLRFPWPSGGEAPRALNRPLWERMESLGIASGRLGSERTGVMR